MERALDNITVSTNGSAQTQGKLTFRRPCFSFCLLKDRLFFFFWEAACQIRESGSESARETTASISRVQLH